MNQLNQGEKDRLQILVNDDFLLATLQKLFLLNISRNKPQIKSETPDSIIGQQYRAFITAKILLTNVFRELEQYKTGYRDKELKNRGE